ncbi:VTC domain-containing protein [Chloroflexota bacterium]
MRHVCRSDSEYPEGQVNSLYFDTDDLDQYFRSASGDFKKDKVRLRWYGKISDCQEILPVFLELKSRQGFASSKQRQRLLVPTQHLEPSRLGAGVIDKTTLIETIAGFGSYPEKPLRPIILVSYWRYRFNEMLTGVRVSFDYCIRSSMVAPELGYGERALPLQGGVIEVKGPTLELPVTLRRLKLLDVDWSRFSKYSYCVESHFSLPGTVARLWPSGRMVES